MIDRKALVTRHAPHYTKAELSAPLSVGNGQFCFTADITGLQSLAEAYTDFPMCTMAEWGWHRYPDAPADDSALRLEMYDTFGRPVGYATRHEGQEDLFYDLRQNAHKVNLARIGLALDNQPLSLGNLHDIDQTLQLWEGVLYSYFVVDGFPVRVITFVHPERDTICARVESPLLANGRLTVFAAFPYGSHKMNGGDFTMPHKHQTEILRRESKRVLLSRKMDHFSCIVALSSSGSFSFDTHALHLNADVDFLEFSLHFALPDELASGEDSFSESLAACKAFWQRYWKHGGVVELAGSRDARAMELERRIVLSQYLLAIQSRGNLPPAETGLTINSWYGKFNVEMHCWHQAHFALWGHTEAMLKSLAWYQKVLPVAKEIARSQGYAGARWPKLCDETGYNSPSSIAVLLIWQQPHPIMLAELCRRQNPLSMDFLREYRDVIVETAEFMVSFAHWDGTRYVLGAPYIPAQERFDPRTVLNAGYEVEYFRWGLRAAVQWLELLDETPNPLYTEVANGLAAPVSYDGVYPAHENCPETYTQLPFYTDHPSMVAMFGLLPPSEKVDRNIMNATLDRILKDWDLHSTWGWDFPMLAMTAARLGRPGDAIDLLLMNTPKNTYLPNGHNRQGDKEDLPLYLPGNGSLLLAVGMMAAGWADSPAKVAPGFPEDFSVLAEGLAEYI